MRNVAALALSGLVLAPVVAGAEDWKVLAGKLDAEMKAFDKRQSFAPKGDCTVDLVNVPPNRLKVSFATIDLRLVNGAEVKNGAGSRLTDTGYTEVSFECVRSPGSASCTTDTWRFGSLPVRPGSEPEACRILLSMLASCQGVASFPASKRGCGMLDWEKEYVQAQASKKEVVDRPKVSTGFGSFKYR